MKFKRQFDVLVILVQEITIHIKIATLTEVASKARTRIVNQRGSVLLGLWKFEDQKRKVAGGCFSPLKMLASGKL